MSIKMLKNKDRRCDSVGRVTGPLAKGPRFDFITRKNRCGGTPVTQHSRDGGTGSK